MSERVIREPGETDPEFSAAHDASDGAYLPTGPGRELSRWADTAMYRSEVMHEGGPRVTLLNATPDPLGSLAALCAMYKGRVVRSLDEVTEEQRRQAFADMQSTQLQGPLEAIQFHFLVEGVTRAWTHQAVRERHAFFAQESMRFAVVEEEAWATRAAKPPSLSAPTSGVADYIAGQVSEQQMKHDALVDAWDDALNTAQSAYIRLVESGIPAEDARGLMPHAMTTRLHMVLNLRTLLHMAGLRLCTQAQFEWRLVMAQVVKALRAYADRLSQSGQPGAPNLSYGGGLRLWKSGHPDYWQFQLIADALRPVCYQQGRCGFMAKFDRGCTIRERVELNARAGRPSSEWHKPSAKRGNPGQKYDDKGNPIIDAIQPSEWAADPTAARRG